MGNTFKFQFDVERTDTFQQVLLRTYNLRVLLRTPKRSMGKETITTTIRKNTRGRE